MAAPLLEPAISLVHPAPDSRVEPIPWWPDDGWPSGPGENQPPLPLSGRDDPGPAGAPPAGAAADNAAVERWAGRLALALFEALQGGRPVGQLTRWADERVLAELAFRRRRVRSEPARPAANPAAGRTRSAGPGRPAVLRSLRIQQPVPEAAEVAAHLSWRGRSYALAFRLEIWQERWLCVALECG